MRMPWQKPAPDLGEASKEAGGGAHETSVVDAFTVRLRERGVTDPEAADLARCMTPDLLRRQPSARAAYLDGAAASWHATSDTRAQLEKSVTDIKEVDRLMGAFTGELSKLDEVLEVLAAYVRRMRTSKNDTETSAGQTLH